MMSRLKTIILIMMALAVISGPAMAQQTSAGAGMTTGTDNRKTFTLGDNTFTINTINQVDATRLQEMGVRTVSVPAGETVYVTYLTSAGTKKPTSFVKGPINMIVFGPNGFSNAVTYTGALPANEPMPTYKFTGTSGQYYVITQRTDGMRDMVLVGVD